MAVARRWRVLTAGFDEQVEEFEPAPDAPARFSSPSTMVISGSTRWRSRAGPYRRSASSSRFVRRARSCGPAASPVVATVWPAPRFRTRRSCQSRQRTLGIAHVVQFSTAAALALPPVEEFWFTSSRGKRIHSFVFGRRLRREDEIPAVRVDARRSPLDVPRRFRAALELPPARAAGLRGAADELQRSTGFGEPSRRASRATRWRDRRRKSTRRRTSDPSPRVRRRFAPGGGRGKLRRSPRELDGREHGPIQGDREPWGLYDLRRSGRPVTSSTTRAQPGWPALGADTLWREQSHSIARRSCARRCW